MAAGSDEKELAYYSAIVSAWIETQLERDKTLITLSAGAIGLIVTILSTVGASSRCSAWLYGASIVFFSLTIGACLWVFEENARYIETIVNGEKGKDKALRQLDRLSFSCFMIGVVLFGLSGLIAASAAGGTHVSREGERRDSAVVGTGVPREEPKGAGQTDSGKLPRAGQASADSGHATRTTRPDSQAGRR